MILNDLSPLDAIEWALHFDCPNDTNEIDLLDETCKLCGGLGACDLCFAAGHRICHEPGPYAPAVHGRDISQDSLDLDSFPTSLLLLSTVPGDSSPPACPSPLAGSVSTVGFHGPSPSSAPQSRDTPPTPSLLQASEAAAPPRESSTETTRVWQYNRYPTTHPNTVQLRQHVKETHLPPGREPCGCPCDECNGAPVQGERCGQKIMPASVIKCLCGKSFVRASKEKDFVAHLRSSTRRRVRCCCGRPYRDTDWKSDRLSDCNAVGPHNYVCWKPDTLHRMEFATKEELLRHLDFDCCERRSRGAPRKRKSPDDE